MKTIWPKQTMRRDAQNVIILLAKQVHGGLKLGAFSASIDNISLKFFSPDLTNYYITASTTVDRTFSLG